METDTFIGWQFGMTLLVGLAIAVFLFMRVRKSRNRDAAAGQEPHSSMEGPGIMSKTEDVGLTRRDERR